MKLSTAIMALVLLAGCAREAAPQMTETSVRFAAFNAYLNRPAEGGLIADLKTPDNVQARKVAEIIQRVAPDVLLLSEFDYDQGGDALRLFRENYLERGWNGAEPAVYPYAFLAPSNTGVHSGHDLDRDGAVTPEPGSRGYGGDAFGYGEFPGQYAFVLLSKYPIDEAGVRTFQTFLWKDMPGALLPADPQTPGAGWYDENALAVFRLSSKNHVDIPVIVDGERVHVLASHPTPPAFDGDEKRNVLRNHDEIRFWADYVSGAGDAYIYDDAGVRGGLAKGARFVVMGDLNADPNDGAGAPGAIARLLTSPSVADVPAPRSKGGAASASLQGGANAAQQGDPAEDTADFNDDPERGTGNLRLDYVLFSKAGLRDEASGVFWPAPDEAHYDLVGPGFPVESSDHRLVWRDLLITDD